MTTYSPPEQHTSLANTSSFSHLYHPGWLESNEDDTQSTALVQTSGAFDLTQTDLLYSMPELPELSFQIHVGPEDLIYYFNTIIGKQYQLNKRQHLRSILTQGVKESPSSQVAAVLLAQQERRLVRDEDFKHTLCLLRENLFRKTTLTLTGGDAIAALQSISAVLFKGGIGFGWRDFLSIAGAFSRGVFDRSAYPAEALWHCTSQERFIVKITLWFDVLASITLQCRPRFSDVFRNLFEVQQRSADCVNDTVSMLGPMGCENRVAWALCEIMALAQQKTADQLSGYFSNPRLVAAGNAILQHLQPKPVPIFHLQDDENGKPPLAKIRWLTSEVFRTSAIVLLHNVVSGDYPRCPEIKDGIRDTITCLQNVPPSAEREVVRSVVSCICICGCLTDDLEEQTYLVGLLKAQYASDVTGNSRQVQQVMQDVWNARAGGDYTNWRDIISSRDILLV